MDQGSATWLVLLAAVVAANAPYFSKRVLLVGPRQPHKSPWWRILELALLAVAVLMLGFMLESNIGQRQPQGWEFYAASTCLFLVLGFPGFVWAYLRRHRGD